MSTLTWRDNSAGREITFPWRFDGEVQEPEPPLTKDTPLGRAAIFAAIFEDASVGVGLMFPGGHRFLRISPETDWAMEERWEGAVPDQIAKDIEYAWQSTVDLFAARNKQLREARAALSSSRGDRV